MGRPNLRWRFLLAMLPALLATSAATDTMNPGDTLRDGESLISTKSSFKLGFFSPSTSSRFRYLGIWYGTISQQTVIWVANRERGINDSTGVLSFHGNGSLVLSDARGDVYWSTGAAAGVVASPVARLLDSANFVVTSSGGGGAPAWQSFDYPTDSLLPGMKLGWDLRTGRNRNITSWRSAEDPAPGDYSMVLDVRGDPQIFLVQGATPLWRTGPWIGQRFSGIPEMKTFTFHNGADEVYYRFDTLNNTILSRLVVQPTGVVERVVWIEGTKSWTRFWFATMDQCDTFGTCGNFGVCDVNSSPICSCLQGFDEYLREGRFDCARRTALDCRNGTDGFVQVEWAKLPDTSAAVMNSTMGLDECRAACLRNCSCTAYAETGAGCTLWGGNLTDIRVYYVRGSVPELYVRVAAADLVQSASSSTLKKKSASSSSKRVLPVAATAVGALLGTVVLGWICWFLWRWRRKTTTERVLRKNGDVVAAWSGTKTKKKKKKKTSNEYQKRTSDAVEDLDDLPLIDFTSIVAATGGFSAENKLGEGGFGPVYVVNV